MGCTWPSPPDIGVTVLIVLRSWVLYASSDIASYVAWAQG